MIMLKFVLFNMVVQLCYAFDSSYFSNYINYSVYRVMPVDENGLKLVKDFTSANSKNIDVWKTVNGTNKSIDIMVKPLLKPNFLSFLETNQIKYIQIVEDVGKSIQNQIRLNYLKDIDASFNYEIYHTLQEIYDWMYNIQNTFSDYVTLINITKSFNGNPLIALKISIPNDINITKPAIWMDGCIHAREWISTAILLYMTNELLENYGKDTFITKLLDTFDVYILPVFNVDGYEHSWSTNRLWRKSMSKNSKSNCTGTDMNRNWGYLGWGGPGSSTDPCDETFCGTAPFSEPEVKGVSEFLLDKSNKIISYINFHSYSQLWLTPFGFTRSLSNDHGIQTDASIISVSALAKLYNTLYADGPIYLTLYPASGSSIDWTYGYANIIFSFTVELRDTGANGFILPPSEIKPTALETLEGVKALLLYIKNLQKISSIDEIINNKNGKEKIHSSYSLVTIILLILSRFF